MRTGRPNINQNSGTAAANLQIADDSPRYIIPREYPLPSARLKPRTEIMDNGDSLPAWVEVVSVGGIGRERVKQKPFRIARNGIFNLTHADRGQASNEIGRDHV